MSETDQVLSMLRKRQSEYRDALLQGSVDLSDPEEFSAYCGGATHELAVLIRYLELRREREKRGGAS